MEEGTKEVLGMCTYVLYSGGQTFESPPSD